MIGMNSYTLEAFTTGARHTVTAPTVWDALADQPEPCFTVTSKPGGRYAAISLENDAFPVAGEVVAGSPEAAAAAIRQQYAAVKASAA